MKLDPLISGHALARAAERWGCQNARPMILKIFHQGKDVHGSCRSYLGFSVLYKLVTKRNRPLITTVMLTKRSLTPTPIKAKDNPGLKPSVLRNLKRSNKHNDSHAARKLRKRSNRPHPKELLDQEHLL
jgi:hypothetical protein